MSIFLLPTLTFIVYLLSLLIVFNYIFTKEFLFWLPPFILSLFFLINQVYSLYMLFRPADSEFINNSVKLPFLSGEINFSTIIFIFSLIWLSLIITYHYALREHKKPKDKRKEMMKKNYYATQYIQLIEQKELDTELKKKNEKQFFGTRKPVLNKFSDKWVNKFDN